MKWKGKGAKAFGGYTTSSGDEVCWVAVFTAEYCNKLYAYKNRKNQLDVSSNHSGDGNGVST